MKRVTLVRMLSLLLCAAMGFGMAVTVLPTRAEAAATTTSLADLLTEGKIKPLGRTQVNKAGTGITANWSANGFEINVKSNGGKFTVGYDASSDLYTAVLVDDTLAWRGLTTGKGTVSVELTAGTHKVSVMRENGHSSSASAYLHYTTVSFDGTVEARPADKNLFIEVIGDSYACGSGSAEGVSYAPGVQWCDMDHSGRASFGWYLSQMLNADVSIVARGGIGLTDGTEGKQEATTSKATMVDIYPNASGHNTSEGTYTATRKADLVVIEMGANDGLGPATIAKNEGWIANMNTLVGMVRQNYGADTKILMLSHTAYTYSIMLKMADEDPYIYSCHFSHFGNGSAALARQMAGHPSAEDEYEIAKALKKTIDDWDILGAPVEVEPTYNDIVYYVSENGNDSNDGKTIGTAVKTLYTAMNKADKLTLADGSRVVVYLQGSVANYDNNTVDSGHTNNQYLGGNNKVVSSSGKPVPVLVTTYNYDGSNKAVLDTSHVAVNNGNASLNMVNDFTFRGITIQGTAREGENKGNATYCRDRNLYCGYYSVVFDDVSFTLVGDESNFTDNDNKGGWRISAGRFGAATDPGKPTLASVTFLNGDYSVLDRVSAVQIDAYSDDKHAPSLTHKLVIGEGAHMGVVYGAYGKLGCNEIIVEFRGGSVNTYYATRPGTSSATRTFNSNITTVFAGTEFAQGNLLAGTGNYCIINGNVTTRFEGGVTRSTGAKKGFCGTGTNCTINGDVTVEFKKGQFVGELYAAVGSATTVNGNVTNNISGGEIRVTPVGAKGEQGVYLAGYSNAKIKKVAGKETTTGNVTNNISGGDINVIYTVDGIDCGLHLGLRSGTIDGDLINNVSGGNLYSAQFDVSTVASAGIYFGSYGGDVLGCFNNNITGGVFSLANHKPKSASDSTPTSTGGLSLGNRTVHNRIGSVKTTIGVPGSQRGPRFLASITVAAGRSYIGGKLTKPSASATCPTGWTQDLFDKKVLPKAENYTGKTLIETTIYSGYFDSTFYASPNSANDYNSHYYSYTFGDVVTNVYGGQFMSTFYGAGASPILGHVTTNIYGGSFTSIYGAAGSYIYDGVETNIYGLTELKTAVDSETPVRDYKIYASGTSAKIMTRTEGRDAVKLTIAPEKNSDLILRTPIYAGFSSTSGKVYSGNTTVSVQGGIYPDGFKVSGKSVADALASGYEVISHISGSKLSYAATDTEVVGYAEVVPAGQGSSRELVYYVRPNGNDSNDGLSFIMAKKTLVAALQQAVKDNGNSTVFPNGSQLTIYIDGIISNASNAQKIGTNKLTTADGNWMNTVVTTYNYNGTKATVNMNTKPINGGNASAYMGTDITFKDVNLLSKAYYHDDKDDNKKDGWFCTNKLYAAGCNLTFDNATILTDGKAPNYTKWIIGADHFGTGGVNPTSGKPVDGVITFKNGDYTNLDYVTTVNANNIWVASNDTRTEMPNITSKIIIEEGAIMDDVFGPIGKLNVGSSTIEVRGGTIRELNGTGHGDKSIPGSTNILVSGGTVETLNGTGNGTKVNIAGDVNITVTGGTVGTFNGTGTDATIGGDVNITVSDGTVDKFVALQKGAKVTTLTSTFSGGQIGSYAGTATGAESAKLTYATNMTTTVSGATVGSFVGTGNYVDFTGDINNAVTNGTVGSFKGTGTVATINGSVNNTVSGGTITNFAGTGDGTANETAKKVTITGDVNNTISGGTFNGKWFLGAGNSVNIVGQIHNTISDGDFTIVPVSTGQKDAYFFAGRDYVTAGSVHNEISGGIFTILYETDVDAAYYFGGGSSAVINGDVVNDITGGIFRPMSKNTDTKVGKNGTMYLGQYSGQIKGKLENNLVYFEFDNGGHAATPGVTLGGRAANVCINSVVNVIGDPVTGTGPIMDKGNFSLGAGWAQIGTETAVKTKAKFDEIKMTEEMAANIVLSSTIYGGTFPGIVYGAPTGKNSETSNHYAFVKGSVETNIYGGTFNEFRVGGVSTVFGNVTGNVYGGSFATINISDGVSNVKGTKNLTIYGGTFPKGMTLTGVTIDAALAENRGLIEDATGIVLDLLTLENPKVSGTAAVTVKPVDRSLKFTGASVTLYNDLSVGFKADGTPFTAENGYTEPYAEFRSGGNTIKVTEYKMDEGRLVFDFSNIAPHRIGDTITATLYAYKDGVLYAGTTAQYSVKNYCTNMLTKYPTNQKLGKLLVDLLNYGAAAQNYDGHNTNALVNAGLTDEQKAMGTQSMPAVSNAAQVTVNTLEGATVAWKGAGLYLEDAVTVRLTLEADSLEGLTFRFLAGGKTATVKADELVAIEGETNRYYLYFDKLNAAQMRVPLQVVALRDGEAVSNTVQYSIECYVANKYGTADSNQQLDALLDAMIRYGDAAENYVK